MLIQEHAKCLVFMLCIQSFFLLLFLYWFDNIALQDILAELELKMKKYLRGESANLEVQVIEVAGIETLVLDNGIF